MKGCRGAGGSEKEEWKGSDKKETVTVTVTETVTELELKKRAYRIK